MNSHYIFPNALDASNPSFISPPAPGSMATMARPTSNPALPHSPSPSFPGGFGIFQRTHSAQNPRFHSRSNTATLSRTDNGHRYSPTTSCPPNYFPKAALHVRTNSVTDFEFAETLRAVSSSRSCSDSEKQGMKLGGEVQHQSQENRKPPLEVTEPEAAVAETIVRARKSWKTVKGRSEAVWPPDLEKALVQALLQYKPHDSRYARALGRFPKRNRYISDFIFVATGVRRTPKQVGSRLQQLKDVSCGKMLLNHVASWSLTPHSSNSTPLSSDGAPPVSSVHLHPNLNVLINDGHKSEGSLSPVSPTAGAGARAKAFAALDLTPYNAHSGPYMLSAPSSPFETPPLSPLVREMHVFIPFDPAAIGFADVGKREDADGRGQELVQFTGCLSRPGTVLAPDFTGAIRPTENMVPNVTFTARDPIAAQSLVRVWVEDPSTPSSSSYPARLPASLALPHGQKQKQMERGTMTQVHQYCEPLACKQMPFVRASAAQSSFYSFSNITMGRESSADGHGSDTSGGDAEVFVYATRLVDDAMWRAMCREGGGLSKYTITQELMYSFDSPGTSRGDVFLAITYNFVPTDQSRRLAAYAASPNLQGHGHGYGHFGLDQGRNEMSPASSTSPSPISASPSSAMFPTVSVHTQQTGRMHGHASVHPHLRVPHYSIHPSSLAVSPTEDSISPFAQDEFFDVNGHPISPLSANLLSDNDIDFQGLAMDNLHLSTGVGLQHQHHLP